MHRHPTPVPILSQIKWAQTSPSHFYFNIILPSMPRSSKWPLSLRSPHQNSLCNFPVFDMYHMSHPSHSSWFDDLNNIWWEIHIIMLLFISLLHLRYLVLIPIYLLQHPVVEHPQPMFLPRCERPSSHPYKVTGKITLPYILIFIFLDSKPEDRRFCTEWQ